MKNKELQEQRMRGYFIQATKDILRAEGLKAISVRSVADKAGYSYATLYNYFKDINDLVFLCVNDFQKECNEFVIHKVQKIPRGIERLKASILAYINFFVEYPGIFELFYLVKGGDFGNKQQILNLIENSLYSVCKEEWEYCYEQKIVAAAEIESAKLQLNYAVVGMLVLYLNRLIPASYDEFTAKSNTMVDSLLAKAKL